MKKIFLLLSVFLATNVLVINAQVIKEVKYTLELFTADSKIPITRNAYIYSEGKSNYISIQFQDELKSTQIIKDKSTDYKFQISEIQNDGLVSIQFIGSRNILDRITGIFNATIDGVPRKDMSGSFTLVKNEVQELLEVQEVQEVQTQIGGHIGVVHGLFTLQDGDISGIFDSGYEYSVGFPMGITVKKRSNFAFDLEIVPSITFKNGVDQEKVDLLIHPGLLWGLGNNLTFGTRLAFELGEYGRYGITPLLNLGNIFSNGFIELVLQ